MRLFLLLPALTLFDIGRAAARGRDLNRQQGTTRQETVAAWPGIPGGIDRPTTGVHETDYLLGGVDPGPFSMKPGE
jgi:hypothetical protein